MYGMFVAIVILPTEISLYHVVLPTHQVCTDSSMLF